MATLKQEFIFFNDGLGRPIPGASMYFYEAGTLTPKATYADVGLISPNTWPVVADAAGRFPVIYLAAGGYRIIVKDDEDVQVFDRDNLNIEENILLTSSDFVFSTLIDAKQGILINGESVDLQIGQSVTTLGQNTSTDGLGGDWVVVAGGTGTADDDLYSNLDNGKQLQKLFNFLYTPPDVANFTKAVTHYQRNTIKTLALDVAGTFAAVTYETVGPTGSGADHEWTELDSLLPGAKYVDLTCRVRVLASATTSLVSTKAYLAPTSAVTIADTNNVASAEIHADTATSTETRTSHRIALDSNLMFKAAWGTVGPTTGEVVQLYFEGFGV